MFGELQDRLAGAFKKLRGHGTLSEENITDALRDVRLSLLEADVHFQVVKKFVGEVKTKAVGAKVTDSLSPYQDFVRIVSATLTETMGGQATTIDFAVKPPVVIMLMGLQGSGKTTSAAKLARRLKGEGKTPLLVPADIQRPAAIQQLQTLGRDIGVEVFQTNPKRSVKQTAKDALAQADRQGQDVVIVDTAGRLQIDTELMEELREAKEILDPNHCLLVVDAMTGQDAVNVATEFKAQVGIDGVVLTKMDGDARGGAALSVRAVTGAPIYFVGLGEKPEDFDIFHPDRITQRILGMGDVMSLIEKTNKVYDEKKAKQLAKKMKKADFTFDDFREQLQMMRQMGDMKDLLKMIPGMDQAMKKFGAKGPDPDAELKRIDAMISSMTAYERANPKCLNPSRRRRIAKGSGLELNDVNGFVKRFNDAKKVMKRLSKLGPGGLKQMMSGLGGGGPGRGGRMRF